ncbi:MAG: DNA recombination protein RmuC [Muribaculaceae bacterium]|nr:DNA recombination protein RmuC [Muribaculaceae bacterium]
MTIAITLLAAALAAAVVYIFTLLSRNARLDERLKTAQEALVTQRADFDRLNAEAEKRFAALADRSLASNAESLRRQSTQSLSEVLAPMRENLENFRQTVLDSYSREARERFSLGEKVRELITMSNTIGYETRRLTDALKGNSRMQGDWGEMILDNILEHAGLRRGYEYHVQESVTDADGRRLRPDVIIDYTDGRHIIIDSKVSIQDYFEMLNAADENSRAVSAKAHVASVKKHIAELRCKNYQDTGNARNFDYVLMFIPHEGAFLAAMNLDNTLWQTAFDSRVLIISPTHLMSIVKLIEQMWRHDKQNRNAIAIADEAGKMLDKFRSFLDDMDKVSRTVDAARSACDDAIKKLSSGTGNLLSRAEKLRTLGAKAKKGLPQRFSPEDPDTDEVTE